MLIFPGSYEQLNQKFHDITGGSPDCHNLITNCRYTVDPGVCIYVVYKTPVWTFLSLNQDILSESAIANVTCNYMEEIRAVEYR